MRIDHDFEGGNIEVISIGDHEVTLACEQRDTEDDWFYWAFRVCGAQGKTFVFSFIDKQRVGYFGGAVSHDNKTWEWTNSALADYTGFAYTFGPDEKEVYFCHDLRYGLEQFQSMTEELNLDIHTLCLSEKGRHVPYVRFGEGEQTLLLAARHHACESTGNYVMEGILRELVKKPLLGVAVIAIPFIDLDGVVDGDQGKNRKPHDHNRDYGRNSKSIYAAVRAVRSLADQENIVWALDLHSPWHFGGRNDVCFEVRKNIVAHVQARFGELLQAQSRKNAKAFQYQTVNDLDEGCEWNINSQIDVSFSGFFTNREGVRLSLSIETPYFGTVENRATQQSLTELGICAGQAIRNAFEEGM